MKIFNIQIVIYLIILNFTFANAQDSNDILSESFYINYNQTDSFKCYVFKPHETGKFPLVVFLMGSGSHSAFGFTKRKLAPYTKNSFLIATMDKIGVNANDNGNNPTENYYKYDYKKARVKSCNLLIYSLKQLENVDTSKIYLIGYSEGTEVAAKVATIRKDIAKLVLIAGGGLCQTEELKILAQKRFWIFNKPVIFFLEKKFKNIKNNPTINKKWYGLTYKRWDSYFEECPIENLRKLDIPILSVHGTRDYNSPIESAMYIKSVFQKESKTNFKLIEYPDCDHNFRNNNQDTIYEVFANIFEWIQKPIVKTY